MGVDTQLSVDLNLLECPFFPSCGLPKRQFLCRFPECKNCPDYITKLKKIRK